MPDIPSIDAALVCRLVAAQFPAWAELPVRPVSAGGWDNRTFHLGDDKSVRLPSAAAYAPQVEKEQRWLPQLAPQLPLPIPAPLAHGAPGEGYPFRWSIYRWLHGETAARDRIAHLPRFATDLARFLLALQRIDARRGPAPGPDNFFRGGPLATYHDETQRLLASRNPGEPLEAAEAPLSCLPVCLAARETPKRTEHGLVVVIDFERGIRTQSTNFLKRCNELVGVEVL